MLATIHLIIFWILFLLYILLSMALAYHWYKYTIRPGVFVFTSIIYLGITLPLFVVMLSAIAAMS